MATIDETKIRQSVFKGLYSTLDINKPTGWTIKAKMPQVSKINSSLPLIVFGLSVLNELPTLDKSSVSDYTVSASFLFIASETGRNSLESIDIAVDTIRYQLKAQQAAWKAAGFFVSEISDEFAEMEVQGGNRLLTAALSCQIKLLTAE